MTDNATELNRFYAAHPDWHCNVSIQFEAWPSEDAPGHGKEAFRGVCFTISADTLKEAVDKVLEEIAAANSPR